MGTWRHWAQAARPKTLNLALTPVVVGSALAVAQGAPLRAGVLLVVLLAALLIQVATNLHNDAADYERGADRPGRVGPPRAVAEGWLTVAAVKGAAAGCLALAFLLGTYLAWVGGWPIVLIGLAALFAAYAYTGGAHPLAYGPFGELFVLLFFGLAATGGSYYLQAGALSAEALGAGFALGAVAAAVLLVNNHRDRAADARAGRRTLALVIGPAASHWLYLGLLALPFLLAPLILHPAGPWRWLPLLLLPLAGLLARRMFRADGGPALNRLLAATARLQLLYGLLLLAGLWLP